MNEITKIQKCLMIRNEIEIWLDEEKWKRLEKVLSMDKNGLPKFINIEGRFVNVVDIVGIFKPQDLEDLKRRKNGQWKCKYNVWHDRGTNCDCDALEKQKQKEEEERKIQEAIKNCGKCDNGWIRFNTEGNPILPIRCKCVKDLIK